MKFYFSKIEGPRVYVCKEVALALGGGVEKPINLAKYVIVE
jgi:hypothetical protein